MYYSFRVLCKSFWGKGGIHWEQGAIITSHDRLDQKFKNAFELLEEWPDPEELGTLPDDPTLETYQLGPGFGVRHRDTGHALSSVPLAEAELYPLTRPLWTEPWAPPAIWQGETVYIIGGGPSIEHADLSALADRRVIGVNDAYAKWDCVDICFFGDYHWLAKHAEPFGKWRGIKVSSHEQTMALVGIHTMTRRWRRGFSGDPTELGWYYNSGTAATCLAIALGAKKVVLIGFDMKMIGGKANWHPNELNNNTPRTYEGFALNFHCLNCDLATDRPDIEVVNANMDSALETFPKIPLEEALK